MKNNQFEFFDSGIGGLTIAKVKVLPNEDFVYFGDTEHLPYGENLSVLRFSKNIINYLSIKIVKQQLLAVTPSSVMNDNLLNYFNNKVVFNVIDPAQSWRGVNNSKSSGRNIKVGYWTKSLHRAKNIYKRK